VAVSSRRSKRWTAEQERDTASQIIAFECEARESIAGIDFVADILNKKGKREERTRAAKVNRLEEAISLVWEKAKEDNSLRKIARQARGSLAQAEELRWALAMSGKRIAHGEARKLSGPFMDESDLVQEGYIGLLRAAKRFEPDKCIRFSTYARWWVRAQMTRAIDHNGRPVRLPGCAVEQTRNLRKVIKNFEDAGEAYSVADLAAEVGIEERRAIFLLSQGATVSLDEPMEDGPRQRSMEHFLEDDEAVRPEDDAIQTQEIARMLEGLDEVLTERHRYVLARRYGLDDDVFRTLSEVGAGMALSRERVRQIEREALMRLRDRANIREVA
jgi:RNA polymerase nonessential primary-like sigma factor